MKYLKKILPLFLLSLCISCNKTENEKDEIYKNVVISVPPDKTTFKLGDEISINGIIISLKEYKIVNEYQEVISLKAIDDYSNLFYFEDEQTPLDYYYTYYDNIETPDNINNVYLRKTLNEVGTYKVNIKKEGYTSTYYKIKVE